MDVIKWEQITAACKKTALTFTKEAVSLPPGITPEDVLADKRLNEAFGYLGVDREIRNYMIKKNTVAQLTFTLADLDETYVAAHYSVEGVIDEAHRLLHLLGKID